jgi:hypothetical protein
MPIYVHQLLCGLRHRTVANLFVCVSGVAFPSNRVERHPCHPRSFVALSPATKRRESSRLTSAGLPHGGYHLENDAGLNWTPACFVLISKGQQPCLISSVDGRTYSFV